MMNNSGAGGDPVISAQLIPDIKEVDKISRPGKIGRFLLCADFGGAKIMFCVVQKMRFGAKIRCKIGAMGFWGGLKLWTNAVQVFKNLG